MNSPNSIYNNSIYGNLANIDSSANRYLMGTTNGEKLDGSDQYNHMSQHHPMQSSPSAEIQYTNLPTITSRTTLNNDSLQQDLSLISGNIEESPESSFDSLSPQNQEENQVFESSSNTQTTLSPGSPTSETKSGKVNSNVTCRMLNKFRKPCGRKGRCPFHVAKPNHSKSSDSTAPLRHILPSPNPLQLRTEDIDSNIPLLSPPQTPNTPPPNVNLTNSKSPKSLPQNNSSQLHSSTGHLKLIPYNQPHYHPYKPINHNHSSNNIENYENNNFTTPAQARNPKTFTQAEKYAYSFFYNLNNRNINPENHTTPNFNEYSYQPIHTQQQFNIQNNLSFISSTPQPQQIPYVQNGYYFQHISPPNTNQYYLQKPNVVGDASYYTRSLANVEQMAANHFSLEQSNNFGFFHEIQHHLQQQHQQQFPQSYNEDIMNSNISTNLNISNTENLQSSVGVDNSDDLNVSTISETSSTSSSGNESVAANGNTSSVTSFTSTLGNNSNNNNNNSNNNILLQTNMYEHYGQHQYMPTSNTNIINSSTTTPTNNNSPTITSIQNIYNNNNNQ